MSMIDPTARIEDGAVIGEGTSIGPYCIIGPEVTIGANCKLVAHVHVMGQTTIGADCKIYPFASLGAPPQISNLHDCGRLQIGDGCTIRESVTMNSGSPKGGGITSVGDRGYFMNCAHVGHDCHVGDNVTFANSVALGGHVEIGDGVIFGGLAAVQQFCRVGKGAMVGGLTGVNRDIIPYAMAFGDHVELAGLNLIGLKRRGLARDTINAMRATFRMVFQAAEGGLVSDRARAAKARFPDVPEVGEIVDFILADAKQELCLARRRGAAE